MTSEALGDGNDSFSHMSSVNHWRLAKAGPADAEDQEKLRLLLELWELQQAGAQEEEVLQEAEEAQESLAEKVEELRRIIVHAEAELRDRRAEQEDRDRNVDRSFGAAFTDSSQRAPEDIADSLPPELTRSLSEQKAEIEALQARHHALSMLMEQANHEDVGYEEVPQEAGSSSSNSLRVQRALREAEELEREMDRLKRSESRLRKEHKSWADQMHEEVREVEARAQDERYALREELVVLSAEGEALDAEMEGARCGMEQVLQRLRHEESALRNEAHETHLLEESRRAMHQSQIQELKAIARSLREENEDPAVQQRRLSSFSTERRPSGSSRRSLLSIGSALVQEEDSQGSRRPSFRGRKPRCSLLEELQTPSPRAGSTSPRGPAREETPKQSSSSKLQAPRGTLHLGVHVAAASTAFHKQAELAGGSGASSCSSSSNGKVQKTSMPVPQLSHRASANQDRMTIAIDKKSGDSLGIHVDSDLLILAVEDGLVADWNRSNRAYKVSAGHRIVEVNGRTEKKPMVKLMKSNQVLNITMVSQGVSSKRDALRKGRLRSTRVTMSGYNCAGAVRVSIDNEDARSVASSGDGDTVSVGSSSAASSKPLRETSSKKLSIIGEDSTITGDGSSRSSSNAGDVIGQALSELDASLEARRVSVFSLDDEEDASSTEAHSNQRGSLEARYDALDTMGLVEQSPKPHSARPEGSAQIEGSMEAADPDQPPVFRGSQLSVPPAAKPQHCASHSMCSEDEESGSGRDSLCSARKRRSSIGWRYDTLDAGETVAVLASASAQEAGDSPELPSALSSPAHSSESFTAKDSVPDADTPTISLS